MIVITVARKSLEGTVAENVLKHGTGALNIDASRVGTQTEIHTSAPRAVRTGFIKGFVAGTKTEKRNYGRWPANLILEHRPGCRCEGTRKVKPSNGSGIAHGRNASAGIIYGAGKGLISQKKGEDQLAYVDSDGLETVAAWECAEGCPVAFLDDQAGVVRSAGMYPSSSSRSDNYIYGARVGKQGRLYEDKGGASRFFKQVQETDMIQVPEDLLEYLITAISPPDERATFMELADWPEFLGKDLCGLIVRGTPTEEQSAVLMEVLRPGAHLLVIAPDTEPTGHTGACRVEDAGFEIRDAILWVREPGKLHYVPKASRSEREEGCQHLPPKTGAEAVDRKEGTAGLDNPRAGAGRTAEEVHNFHPTVKPIALMERLLTGIPTDEGPVVDPFGGSGPTAIACLKTGHDCVSIEMEEDYLGIQDARVRFHDRNYQGWLKTPIESDLGEPEEPEVKEQSLDELFGWDDPDPVPDEQDLQDEPLTVKEEEPS